MWLHAIFRLNMVEIKNNKSHFEESGKKKQKTK
jgi:hypothetical protein